jgi:hypothetical protein
MKNSFVKAILIGSIIQVTAVGASGAEDGWSRVAPQGAGFSIEAPGEPQAGYEPGQYTYSSGLWFLGVKILPVAPGTRVLVERRDRKALVRCLESMSDSMAAAAGATRRGSSSVDVDGYTSFRFSMENADLEGTNLLVLTVNRLFMVMTIGPKGSPDDAAKRFLRSFRLVPPDATPTAASPSVDASSNPVAAKLAAPMLAVARLITEQKLNPRIEDVVQHAPPAARLGDRWGPSNAAYQQARTSFSSRIERVIGAYENSGDIVRTLEAELGRVAPESQAAFATALNGPAGSAIMRQLALFEFVALTMAEDPNGPSPGERAWQEKKRALETVFDQRVGAAVPRDDGAHRGEVEAFFSARSSDELNVLFAVVSKATRELESGINLMIFDESDVIQREVESVIARVK